MKKTLKLIPAIAMLLISAVLVSTSTYAWFSMNTQVNVTGMQISAKSNETWLLISSTHTTASDIQTENKTTQSLTVAETVFPSSPALTSDEAAYLTTSGKTVAGATITTAGVQVDNATKASAVTNWFTAQAIAPGASTINTGSVRQLTAFADYVVVQDLYLTVAVGSENAYQLKVTPSITQVTGGEDVSAVKFLIVTDDGGYAAVSTTNNNTAVDIKGSNTALTDSTVRHVTLYIYYDGDDATVYTNNKANLKGATIELQFDVSTSAS